MVIPENTEVFEFPTSTMWFDENGILTSYIAHILIVVNPFWVKS
jgi:hypothetical protein